VRDDLDAAEFVGIARCLFGACHNPNRNVFTSKFSVGGGRFYKVAFEDGPFKTTG
jgi:hypothetical protein